MGLSISASTQVRCEEKFSEHLFPRLAEVAYTCSSLFKCEISLCPTLCFTASVSQFIYLPTSFVICVCNSWSFVYFVYLMFILSKFHNVLIKLQASNAHIMEAMLKHLIVLMSKY